MEFIVLLCAALVFGPSIYQFSYFKKYQTISRAMGFLIGLGYWSIIFVTLLMPMMIAAEEGTVALIIVTIIALAITGGIFYFIFKKRTQKLKDFYPDDKFIAAKEMIACTGMLIGSLLMIVVIFLPFARRNND